MALYRFSVRTHSKAKIGSIVEGAAYRAGQNLRDHINDTMHYYSRKKGVIRTEIFTPSGVPDWVHCREDLWNEVQAASSRANARFAREIIIALPRELDQEQNWDLLTGFLKEECTSRGMIADVSFHDTSAADGERNPHAHVLLTTRDITSEGFGKVAERWNNRGVVRHWRKAWQDHANSALADSGSSARINHLSIEEQEAEKLYAQEMLSQVQTSVEKEAAQMRRAPSAGSPAEGANTAMKAVSVENSMPELEPPKPQTAKADHREPEHISRAAMAMEKRGIQTRQGDHLRQVQHRNTIRQHLARMAKRSIRAVSTHIARMESANAFLQHHTKQTVRQVTGAFRHLQRRTAPAQRGPRQ